MNVRIVVADGEPISKALRRFKKKMEWSGTAWEVRRRGQPTDQTQERRAKRFGKRFKARQATLVAQRTGVQPVASLDEAAGRFWERTGKP